MKLKLMVLTLALFSFVNATDCGDATATVDDLLGSVRMQTAVAAKTKEEKVKEPAQSDREKLCKIGKDCATLGASLYGFGVRGAAREIKCAVDCALSEENMEKASRFCAAGRDKAYGICSTVGRTVPKYALAAAGALLLDSVTLELLFESSPLAAVAGGSLCYLAYRLNPFCSKKPVRDVRVVRLQEELGALCALKACLEKSAYPQGAPDGVKKREASILEGDEANASGEEDEGNASGEEDGDATAEKAVPGIVAVKEKERGTDASDASAGGGSLQKKEQKENQAEALLSNLQKQKHDAAMAAARNLE